METLTGLYTKVFTKNNNKTLSPSRSAQLGRSDISFSQSPSLKRAHFDHLALCRRRDVPLLVMKSHPASNAEVLTGFETAVSGNQKINRIFKTWESSSSVVIAEDWENAGAQKIMEEQMINTPDLEPVGAGNVSLQGGEVMSDVNKDLMLSGHIACAEDKSNGKYEVVNGIAYPAEGHIINADIKLESGESFGSRKEVPVPADKNNCTTPTCKNPVTMEDEETLLTYEQRTVLVPDFCFGSNNPRILPVSAEIYPGLDYPLCCLLCYATEFAARWKDAKDVLSVLKYDLKSVLLVSGSSPNLESRTIRSTLVDLSSSPLSRRQELSFLVSSGDLLEPSDLLGSIHVTPTEKDYEDYKLCDSSALTPSNQHPR
ncbi:hypothetical protein D5086_017837 [Populus alba]|uniref:Uncharacterized protein n=1 Tax=Populus alba TaxID=43335 RepID=A0ACC4BN60_POPAL